MALLGLKHAVGPPTHPPARPPDFSLAGILLSIGWFRGCNPPPLPPRAPPRRLMQKMPTRLTNQAHTKRTRTKQVRTVVPRPAPYIGYLLSVFTLCTRTHPSPPLLAVHGVQAGADSNKTPDGHHLQPGHAPTAVGYVRAALLRCPPRCFVNRFSLPY